MMKQVMLVKMRGSRGALFVGVFLLLFFPRFLNTVKSQTWVLVWSDEFSTTGLPDPEKWTYDTGGGGWGNNELQYYTSNREENAEVKDSMLIITARKEEIEGYSYSSARLKTQGKFSRRYGKIEARIKLPYGQGIWPAFWMLGTSFPQVGWPVCGEIDIVEKIGGPSNENIIYGTAHWDNNGYATAGGSRALANGDWSDDFHLFSIIWNQWYIDWLVDGQVYFNLPLTTDDRSEFKEPFFMILNVAVGGNWPGDPDGSTHFPQTMMVDYVRVYVDSAMLASKVDPGMQEINIYPNPVSDMLTVDMSATPGMSGPGLLRVYTPEGTLVDEQKLLNPDKIRLGVGHLVPGLYFLHILTSGETHVYRFMKL